MDTDILLKKFTVDENNKLVGNIQVNSNLLKENKFVRPFIRKSNNQEIIKYGNRDYQKSDEYIIRSLNDYYKRLMDATGQEKVKMLNTYRRLYGMWQELHNFKISKNLIEIDRMYDLFDYELYILGYVN